MFSGGRGRYIFIKLEQSVQSQKEVRENYGKYSPEAGIMCVTKHVWNGTLKRNAKNPGNRKKENERK